MSLKKIKELQGQRGFTIVELLIVIVVIGILAAIVIVAYNGVTQQANNSKYRSDADSIRKVAETRNSDASNGAYPTSSTQFTSQFSQLPNGVAVDATEAASAPSYADAKAAADGSPSTYSVNYCTGGLIIYYPVMGGSGSVQSLRVGTTTSC